MSILYAAKHVHIHLLQFRITPQKTDHKVVDHPATLSAGTHKSLFTLSRLKQNVWYAV